MSLTEEISRQPNTLFYGYQELSFLQVYSEEQIGQKEIQSVEFGEEEDTGKANVTAEACAGRETKTVKGGQICI